MPTQHFRRKKTCDNGRGLGVVRNFVYPSNVSDTQPMRRFHNTVS